MSNETKNLIAIALLALFGIAAWRIWMKRRHPVQAANGATAGDIYLMGGIPSGVGMDITNPDGSADSSSGDDGSGSFSSLFDMIDQQSIGA